MGQGSRLSCVALAFDLSPYEGRPICRGISGRFGVEWVADLPWNQWPNWRGIRRCFPRKATGGIQPLFLSAVKKRLRPDQSTRRTTARSSDSAPMRLNCSARGLVADISAQRRFRMRKPPPTTTRRCRPLTVTVRGSPDGFQLFPQNAPKSPRIHGTARLGKVLLQGIVD